MNITPLLRTGTLIANRQLVRQYAFKSDLKIKWVRPEKIQSIDPAKSGDCSKLPAVNGQTLMKGFDKSKELETADATVRSLFELGNNPNYLTTDYCREQMIKEVQRHPLDFGSMEARLARMTATIRRYQEYMLEHPRDKKRKVQLKELIEKRKKFLKYLRRWDYRRFEWILEKLDLVYKPPPVEFHWITRKESLQKLTDIHCEQLKQERLNEYRKTLEEQQIPFLEDAIRKMEFIRQEQIDLDIPVTVTKEEIDEHKKQLEELKLFREETKAAAKKDELIKY
ncbi:28S ribosomal protein S15, mitochondrial [Lucilia sericata]|uniref:28S ribosomal protein S15, mitochondrial n=1 Tax=Lucilia sericata TaxID=13632 RepID=UPI0018A88028|nr:28S ribosomal protein S15, mitochondrial [Lucilia sericata]